MVLFFDSGEWHIQNLKRSNTCVINNHQEIYQCQSVTNKLNIRIIIFFNYITTNTTEMRLN